jgi:hypothetical protein
MIEYEELCAALERYVARTGGVASPRPTATAPAPPPRAPQMTTPSTPAAPPKRAAVPSPSPYDPPTKEQSLPPLSHHDEPHDPDFGALGGHHDDDATHVGSGPGAPPPLAHGEEHAAEIDLGDVLSDDEL